MTDLVDTCIHQPLDHSKAQIRLLHLQPRLQSEPDTIICSLSIADLDNSNGKYEALSYEWGDATNTSFSIILEERKFGVRENLWWALWHLRHPTNVRVLWIDALCIDQNSDEEKNHQVAQMARIYSQSNFVVAWVGRMHQKNLVDGSYSNALDAAKFIQCLIEWSRRSKYVEMQAYEYFGENTVYAWSSLLAFSQRLYWTRLWIVQEVILAPRVLLQCDDLWITGEGLKAAHYFMKRCQLLDAGRLFLDDGCHLPAAPIFQKIHSTCLYRIFEMRSGQYAEDPLQFPLLGVIDKYHQSQCQNLLDKAYALLGIASSCCRKSLGVDYTKSPSQLCDSLLRHHFLVHKLPPPGVWKTAPPEKEIRMNLSLQVESLLRLFDPQRSIQSHQDDGNALRSLLRSKAHFKRAIGTVARLHCEFIGIMLQCIDESPNVDSVLWWKLDRDWSLSEQVSLTNLLREKEFLTIPILDILELSHQTISKLGLPGAVIVRLQELRDLIEHRWSEQSHLSSHQVLKEREGLEPYRRSTDPADHYITLTHVLGAGHAGDLIYTLCSNVLLVVGWDGTHMVIKAVATQETPTPFIASTARVTKLGAYSYDPLYLDFSQLQGVCHGIRARYGPESAFVGFDEP